MACNFEKLENIKLKVLESFNGKLGRLVFKLKLKLKKIIFLVLFMWSNSKFSSSIKLEFDEL